MVKEMASFSLALPTTLSFSNRPLLTTTLLFLSSRLPRRAVGAKRGICSFTPPQTRVSAVNHLMSGLRIPDRNPNPRVSASVIQEPLILKEHQPFRKRGPCGVLPALFPRFLRFEKRLIRAR